ncbi:MAG: GatB/YqeY domain-containing protein [Candidatus Andersenbacteria bacterium]
MTLLEQLDADIKAALKGGEAAKRQTLSMVKSALGNYRIAQRKKELTDADVITVLSKEVKSRKDAAAEFRKGGAEDRAKQEEAEAAMLQKYLPAQMSEADVEAAVKAAIKKTGATSVKEMGKVMGIVSKELKGRADLKAVNQLVKKLLG